MTTAGEAINFVIFFVEGCLAGTALFFIGRMRLFVLRDVLAIFLSVTFAVCFCISCLLLLAGRIFAYMVVAECVGALCATRVLAVYFRGEILDSEKKHHKITGRKRRKKSEKTS